MSQQTSLSQFFKKSNDINVPQSDHHKSSVSVTSSNKRPISPNIDNIMSNVPNCQKYRTILKQEMNIILTISILDFILTTR